MLNRPQRGRCIGFHDESVLSEIRQWLCTGAQLLAADTDGFREARDRPAAASVVTRRPPVSLGAGVEAVSLQPQHMNARRERSAAVQPSAAPVGNPAFVSSAGCRRGRGVRVWLQTWAPPFLGLL